MDIEEYKKCLRKTVVYSKEVEKEYLILGLCSEVGEVAGKYKKFLRGDFDDINKFKDCLELELGDIFWYLVRLCDCLDISVSEVLDKNIIKLTKRLENNKIKGDGDVR